MSSKSIEHGYESDAAMHARKSANELRGLITQLEWNLTQDTAEEVFRATVRAQTYLLFSKEHRME